VLYRPEEFDRLTNTGWDEASVRDEIAAIVADAEAAFDPDELWPADEWDAWQTPTPLKTLYVGAAGVVWALDALRRRGVADVELDLAAAAWRTLERRREEPDVMAGEELPSPAEAGLLTGESGVLAVLWRLERDYAVADDLHALVRANVDNAAEEIMWGSPGTMLAARMLYAESGHERWADAWQESAEALLGRRNGTGMWTQQLYGAKRRALTPPHGVVGNALALLDGGALLPEATRRELTGQTAEVLRRTAVMENRHVSWPTGEGRALKGDDGQIRLQWCAGAPGIVQSASTYLDEDLLLSGAELVWEAGPHGDDKGPGICHGTAGNGYALLKAFERTQDERWLERARRFAVHALQQARRLREQRGHGRYSLWTGDAGVTVYAADCLEARTRYPILESWS
jgi:lantibiotic modifying enzyme